MSILRAAALAVAGLVLVGVSVTLWQGYQLQRELTRAESSMSALLSAMDASDPAVRDSAISELQAAATAAADRTDGAWWGVLEHAPWVGDDVRGLQVLTRTLSLVSTDGVAPLANSVEHLQELSVGGRIDLEVAASLQAPVGRASQVFTSASDQVDRVDTSGFMGIMNQRYSDYADRLEGAASSLRAAKTAVEVLPDFAGAERPRDYLLLFQNNAEIRATGGMPGSWARIHAEGGRISMVEQGTARDFPRAEVPVVPLSSEELRLYGAEYGTYFQDPGFAPDFQRAGEIWEAHWNRRFPDIALDGVLAIDPVGMSYLLEGTGAVRVDGRTLRSGNLVEELLNRPYLELGVTEQDEFFASSARKIFEAATDEIASPIRFVEGFARASREGRFLIAPFDAEDAGRLEGSRVLGGLPVDDGKTPFVNVGVNDATSSKMSFYLRYRTTVTAESCEDGRQQLSGRMTLSQTIAPSAAARLPKSVTGAGDEITEPGLQTVIVRVYAPHGGSIDSLTIDGVRVSPREDTVEGRPVISIVTQLSSRDDVVATWTMESGPGQTGPGRLSVTPGIVRGDSDRTLASACGSR